MHSQNCTPTLRATFRGMTMTVLGTPQVINCTLDIELRPIGPYAKGFEIFYCRTGKKITGRTYTEQVAKQHVERLFREKLVDWHEPGAEVTRLVSREGYEPRG